MHRKTTLTVCIYGKNSNFFTFTSWCKDILKLWSSLKLKKLLHSKSLLKVYLDYFLELFCLALVGFCTISHGMLLVHFSLPQIASDNLCYFWMWPSLPIDDKKTIWDTFCTLCTVTHRWTIPVCLLTTVAYTRHFSGCESRSRRVVKWVVPDGEQVTPGCTHAINALSLRSN